MNDDIPLVTEDEFQLRAIRYGGSQKTEKDDNSYKREPFKFLWTFSGEMAEARQKMLRNRGRISMIRDQVQRRKVVGTVLVMTKLGKPEYGALYQQFGSNFILHSDNMSRALKIPYYPKNYQTNILSSKCWYIDALVILFYIFNLMNLVCTLIAMRFFFFDVKSIVITTPNTVNVTTMYLALYLLLIMLMAYTFSVGHSLSKNRTMALVKLYIILVLCCCCLLNLFLYIYIYKENYIKLLVVGLKFLVMNRNGGNMLDRMQKELQCCGISGHIDWVVLGRSNLPRSCCPESQSYNHKSEQSCDAKKAYATSCANASIDLVSHIFLKHEYMLKEKGIFQWCAFVMCLAIAIAITNGGLEQKNGINYDSHPPTEYFNIVTKGEVEFFLPTIYSEDTESDNYKYMILMNDVRQAINEKQMEHYLDNRYMMLDIV